MTIHLPKINGVGGGNGGGGGSSFPTMVTDSGSSLPVDLSGYQLNDTFLNTSDKKIYTAKTEGYELATGVTNTNITVDLTTGVATGFSAFNQIRKTGDAWTGTKTYDIHFKIGTGTLETDKYYPIYVLYAHAYGNGRDIYVAIKNKQIYLAFWRYGSGAYTLEEEHKLFDYEIQFDTEYYIRLSKNATTTVASISTVGYEGTQIETNTITTVDDFYTGTPNAYLVTTGPNTYLIPVTLSVYLADTTSDWLIPSTTLSWDSGTDLTDKTEYADKTNGILYLYENEVLNAIPNLEDYKKKAETITIDTASITISEIKANANYVFSNNAITDITLSGCETSFEETSIEFTTGATPPTVTDNSGITWMDNFDITNLTANKSYLIVIFNKLGFVKEY